MIPRAAGVGTQEARSLRRGFLRSAATQPAAEALFVLGRTWTYAQMERQARVWAHAIVRDVDRAPRRVGVFAMRSEVAYVGTLAALFSGATFVPLNRTYPAKRTRDMIRRADLDALLVDTTSAPQLEAILAGLERIPLVLLPELEKISIPGARVLSHTELDHLEPLQALPVPRPDDPAYLMFTSGSTGEPKGVPVTHANVLHFIDFITDRYRITPQDRFSQTFDPTFDLSIFDLFVAWESGACVCAMQPIDLLSPAPFLRRHGVTVWFSVPSIPALMRKKNLLQPDCMPTLRWSLFCGEALPRTTAEVWQAAAPGSTLENLYGPTELTVACFVYRWDPQQSSDACVDGLVPIGRPFRGLQAVIVDESLCAVDGAAPGELCVRGPQTVPGYWRDPERTAERFVALSGVAFDALRFYRTGDRVRRLPGGDYAYLGRVDHQIKVVGHRVELGEIEAALRRDADVMEAVAFGWPVEAGSAQGVVAFVSPALADPERLRADLRELLPEYMIPRAIVALPQMPLNTNGKVDRVALRRRLESETGPQARGPG